MSERHSEQRRRHGADEQGGCYLIAVSLQVAERAQARGRLFAHPGSAAAAAAALRIRIAHRPSNMATGWWRDARDSTPHRTPFWLSAVVAAVVSCASVRVRVSGVSGVEGWKGRDSQRPAAATGGEHRAVQSSGGGAAQSLLPSPSLSLFPSLPFSSLHRRRRLTDCRSLCPSLLLSDLCGIVWPAQRRTRRAASFRRAPSHSFRVGSLRGRAHTQRDETRIRMRSWQPWRWARGGAVRRRPRRRGGRGASVRLFASACPFSLSLRHVGSGRIDTRARQKDEHRCAAHS